MRKCLLFVAVLSINCSVSAQTLSQTRTASLFNSISEAFLDLWAVHGTQYISVDDNLYAYSKTLSSHRGALLLLLRDFRFDIPTDATIENITVTARRFKKGKGSIRDYFATLIREPLGSGFGTPYGVWWTNANFYPDNETSVLYSQSASGNNGGVQGNQSYQWTPALLNDPAFGVRIDTYGPQGSVVVYYDLVTITVEYLPAITTQKSHKASETKMSKEPQVCPNPFTTKTNIQFTAVEDGNAAVELYSISGLKLRTVFSGKVIQGQIYNVAVGDAQLPNGIYFYTVINSRQKHTGRIVKLE